MNSTYSASQAGQCGQGQKLTGQLVGVGPLGGGVSNAQARKPSLLADSNRLIERLIEIHAKSERFADTLCGHAPTPITNQLDGKPQGGAPAETNLQFNLDSAMRWVERIETHLMRIESGL